MHDLKIPVADLLGRPGEYRDIGFDHAFPGVESGLARLTPAPVAVVGKAESVVEGILVLAVPELRSELDLRIYVDTDPDLRLARRIERDINERGRTVDSVIAQYLSTVRPMHIEFVEPSRRHADLIIPEGYNPAAVATVTELIRSRLEGRY